MRASVVVLALALGAGLGGCAEKPTDAAAPVPPVAAVAAPQPRYLALGDSFTIGTGGPPSGAFPVRLVERWRDKGCAVQLENVAVNGYTTDDLVDRELPSIATFKPTLITVAIGANDIVRGSGVDAYRTNIRKILGAAVASGARVVVVPQPDWSRSPVAAAFGTPESLDASIRAFNQALAEEARAKSVTFVDLAPLMREQAAKKMVASDGLHPNAAAYDAWADELSRALAVPCSG